MVATEFRSEVARGSGFEESITRQFVAHDTSIALWGPVVLSTGSQTKLAEVASTTTAGDVNVIGVCVMLPGSGTIIADTSFVTICVFGICKLKVADATVNLNAALDCSTTAAVARVQPLLVTRNDTTTHLQADVVTGLNNIRAAFAIALSTSSNANSIIAAFVHIQTCSGGVT